MLLLYPWFTVYGNAVPTVLCVNQFSLPVRYVAWGEYPLCFAAVLNQEECFRLILNRGANHDLQDTNGNSITHILVVFNNIVSPVRLLVVVVCRL